MHRRVTFSFILLTFLLIRCAQFSGEKMINTIKALISLRGVSQSDIVRNTGVSKAALNRFLNDSSDMRSDSLVKVLTFLGADVRQLIRKELGKALGHFDEVSVGDDLKKVISALDPIAKRTILDTILVSASRNQSIENKNALRRVRMYRDSIQTVRRVSC